MSIVLAPHQVNFSLQKIETITKKKKKSQPIKRHCCGNPISTDTSTTQLLYLRLVNH